jgi:hypothetical protein
MMNFSTISQNYYRVSIGTFFTVATVFLIYFVVWIFPEWQATWNKGWENLNTIASSVDGVSQTVQPLSVTAPVIVEQLKVMNATVASQLKVMNGHVGNMDQSISGMKIDVQHMATNIPSQMGVMSNEIGHMRRNITPGGMTDQLMPW